MRTIMIILLITLLILVVGFILAAIYFCDFALKRSIPKDEVANQEGETYTQAQLDYLKVAKEFFEANNKEISMDFVGPFKKDLKLAGYVFEQDPAKPWVVVVHGFTTSALAMAQYVMEFYHLGYNVLAIDNIAHGKSQGEYFTMGGYDGKALAQWCKLLDEQYSAKKIAIFGISMGAATVINSLNDNLPSNVECAIEESGYLDLMTQYKNQLKKLYNLPPFPILPLTSQVAKIKAGYAFEEVNATPGLKKWTKPLLVMHGTNDGFVETAFAKEIYDLAATNQKELKYFENSKHVAAVFDYKEEYWKTVKEFLDKYMN